MFVEEFSKKFLLNNTFKWDRNNIRVIIFRTTITFLIFLLFISARGEVPSLAKVILQEYRTLHTAFHYKKSLAKYGFSLMENFLNNKLYIAKHNEKFYLNETSFLLGMNALFDWTSENYTKTLLGFNIYQRRRANEDSPYLEFLNEQEFTFKVTKPWRQSFNWVNYGVVGPVPDQRDCACDYAQAALGALESQYSLEKFKKKYENAMYNKYKLRDPPKPVKLSIQRILDCAKDFESLACEGGLISRVYDFVITEKGIVEESSYPTTFVKNTCTVQNGLPKRRISGYKRVKVEDETQLKHALNLVGPIAAAIDARGKDFQFYKSGVFSSPECDSNNLNHAVLIVGYGEDKVLQKEYWLIQNSWGTSWGENGYMRIHRNAGNMCGIASAAYYPVLN